MHKSFTALLFAVATLASPMVNEATTNFPPAPTNAIYGRAPAEKKTSSFKKVTAAPSGSKVISEPFTLPTKNLAKTCTGEVVPIQTSFWMKTNQVNLFAGEWFKGEEEKLDGRETKWRFSSNTPGVVLGVPYIPSAQDAQGGGAQVKFDVKERKMPNYFDLTVGPLSDGFQFQVYNDNGSTDSIPRDAWKLKKGQKDSDRTDLDGIGVEEVFFEFRVEGYGVCDWPVANTTCRDGNVKLDQANWKGYHVDEFFANWTKSRKSDGDKPYGENGMMELFKHDFGISTDVCTVQEDCESLQACSNQANPDSKDAIAIYLAYQAMTNAGNYFNTLYNNVVTSANFETNSIEKIVQDFYKHGKDTVGDAGKKAPPALALSSAILGLASFGVIAIPGVGLGLGAVTGLASGATGMADLFDHDPSKAAPKDANWANAADLKNNLNDLLATLQYDIRMWHQTTLSNGANITELFKNGAMVDQQQIEFTSEKTAAAAAWLEQYVLTKLINRAWFSQNVYIMFMPYGEVIKQDGSGDKQHFDEDQCASNFRGKNNQIVICDTTGFFKDAGSTFPYGPGMARLTWYDSEMELGPGECAPDGFESGQATHATLDLSKAPPGWANHPKFNSGNGDYQFNAEDVVISSLKSWIKDGYGYDFIAEQSDKITGAGDDEKALKAMVGLQSTKPSDAGMFNLPVVVSKSLKLWPDFSTDSSFKDVFDQQKDRNGNVLSEGNTLPPQLQKVFTRYDSSLDVVKNSKCKK